MPPAAVWWVAGCIACLWFLSLDARHLLRADEGRYAEIAREMFVSGDWVTIRYNGLKYFEKPPFHLWMTAIAYHLFGVGDWQARLWVALSGAIGTGMTMLAAARWFGRRVGLLTGLVLVATPSWYLAAHFNSLDMGVAAALACTLAGVLLAQHPLADAAQRRRWMWFAWGAMGVAVLTKGLIGIVLPGLVLVCYTLLARDWALWRRLHLLSGAVIALAITAPWFVLVSLRNPEFARFFFIHEHWDRYTSSVHLRSAPWWYFGPQLLAGFLPWLGLLPGMIAAVRRDREPVVTPPAAGEATGFRPVVLLAVWVVAIFAFFSASGSKLPGYIAPVFPALGIMAALALARIADAAWNRVLLGTAALAAIGLVASPLLGRSGDARTPSALFQTYALWLAAALATALVGFAVAWALRHRGRLFASITAYSLTLLVTMTIALIGHETFGRASSGVDLAAAMRAVLTPSMPVYSVRLLDHTVPFYLGRTTIMVEQPDELAFGTRQEPQKWLPTLADFLRVWASGPKALAMMSPDLFAELQRRGVVMHPVGHDERRVVVANFAATSKP